VSLGWLQGFCCFLIVVEGIRGFVFDVLLIDFSLIVNFSSSNSVNIGKDIDVG